MTTKNKRKAVVPPSTSKVEAKAPLTEKKFVPQFTNKQQEYKPTVYRLVTKAKKRNGMPQYPVVSLLKAEDIIFDPELVRIEKLDTSLERLLYLQTSNQKALE